MNARDTNSDAPAEGVRTSSVGAVKLLCLAAAPTFALMAVLTGMPHGGPAPMLCMEAHGASPLSGMAAMYLLMSAFHLAPWLRLIARQRTSAALLSP